MKDNTESNFIIVDINYFFKIGKGLIETINDLDDSDIYAANILATTAVEISLKSLLASNMLINNLEKSEADIRKLIMKKFTDLNHKLDEIFDACQEVKECLGIKNIKCSQNMNLVYQYEIKLNDGGIIILKNSEAARYGPFSRTKDIFIFNGAFNKRFLNDIFNLIEKMINENNNKILTLINK